MAWMGDDPLTGDVPHRDLVDEEDEEQAAELAPQYCAPPQLGWEAGAAAPQAPTAAFLVGQAACLLLDAFFPGTQVVGRITVPELVRVRSPMEEEYGVTRQPVHACSLHARPAGDASLLLVACPRELPAEQAAAWAAAVLAALAPARVVVAATLPAMSYRGPGDAADADLIFSLQTAAAAADSSAISDSGAPGLPPPLPEATVLGGLPAALLARCELAGTPARLVAGVQAQQVPDAQFLYSLGRGVQTALAASGDAAAGGAGLASPRMQLVAALGSAADAVYRSSASSSIFS